MTTEDGKIRSTTGAALIAAERKRQIEAEGWTAEHDARLHSGGQLAEAAAAYVLWAAYHELLAERIWPFERAGFKPVRSDSGHAIGSLVKAGALIAAEIDRLTVVGA